MDNSMDHWKKRCPIVVAKVVKNAAIQLKVPETALLGNWLLTNEAYGCISGN